MVAVYYTVCTTKYAHSYHAVVFRQGGCAGTAQLWAYVFWLTVDCLLLPAVLLGFLGARQHGFCTLAVEYFCTTTVHLYSREIRGREGVGERCAAPGSWEEGSVVVFLWHKMLGWLGFDDLSELL